jgi:hypothetical protein
LAADSIPLTEDSPLPESRDPYRKIAPGPDHWVAQYDEVLVEQALMRQTFLAATILRFPAVIGPGDYRRFQRWLQPMLRGARELRIHDGWARWRWTHGFAGDVAEAVVLAVTNSSSAGRIYNVGEFPTPTMAKQLAESARAARWPGRILEVPASALLETDRMQYDFTHHIVYGTNRIRSESGYKEVIPMTPRWRAFWKTRAYWIKIWRPSTAKPLPAWATGGRPPSAGAAAVAGASPSRARPHRPERPAALPAFCQRAAVRFRDDRGTRGSGEFQMAIRNRICASVIIRTA